VAAKLASLLKTVSQGIEWLRDHIYEPEPIDTSKVEISEELLGFVERRAKNNHDLWAKRRITEGWKYGPVRNEETKQNPDIRFYNELPESEKEYDRESVSQTLKAIVTMVYQIVKA